ncbi:MAG: glycosyltransferase [Phycisphaerales bacterium]|nr:glycosyltransferase [Phycisphaerales bacterium]
MRVILLVDRDFAHRELRLIRKVAIGLVDAGWRTIVALPDDMTARFDDVPGVQAIGYRDRGVPWTRSLRARELTDQTQSSTDDPTVVHVFGSRAYGIASDVARYLGVALVLEVHARDVVQKAVSILNDEADGGLALTPCTTLVNALIAAGVQHASAREIPWGVASRDAIIGRETTEVMGVVLAGTGSNPQLWEAAIRGLALVASRREDFVILADDTAVLRSGIDKLVHSIGLSPLLSRIPRLEADRELVLRADIMLWPDHDGEHRSIVLDAMAWGVAVVASEDRDVPVLCNPSIAQLVSGDPAEWAGAIEALLAAELNRRELGRRAHEHISQHHRPSKHVAGLLDAYEWMLGKDAIMLPKDDA